LVQNKRKSILDFRKP